MTPSWLLELVGNTVRNESLLRSSRAMFRKDEENGRREPKLCGEGVEGNGDDDPCGGARERPTVLDTRVRGDRRVWSFALTCWENK